MIEDSILSFMFKKPLAELKTSAPLRSSDRRKLKQKVVQIFSLEPDIGDLLVPDGLLSLKITTHLEEPGVCYTSPDGNPLWFTLGKGSEDLIPTVYTLWKKPDLLPILSTPPAVIPVLIGGADLMVPGVVQHSTPLSVDQLVAVTQYHPPLDGKPQIGPPLAVGRMAISHDKLGRDGRGKAVHVFHTWKDHLFEMGKKIDLPDPRVVSEVENEAEALPNAEGDEAPKGAEEAEAEPQGPSLTPQEISNLLRISLIQCIATTLSKFPPSSFPISATLFYTSYLLPSRPIEPTSSSSTPVDIKHSAHKSLGAFLRVCSKDGLIKIKESKGDVVVTGVSKDHKDVDGHVVYRTIKEVEARKEKKEGREREEQEKQKEKERELQITLLWKPHVGSAVWFKAAGKDATDFYTLVEVRALLNEYLTKKQLLNPQDQSYVDVVTDAALLEGLSDGKTKEKEKLRAVEFMKRDEVAKKLVERMQAWYEIRGEGKDTVLKKGTLSPISIVVKTRQGKRASTLITGFEPFFLDAEELAEDMRKACACSTSVHPIAGKPSGQEVLIQGKHSKIVADFLQSKGVPKKWLEASDLTGKK